MKAEQGSDIEAEQDDDGDNETEHNDIEVG